MSTGANIAKTLRMFRLMGVACISKSTFFRHTRLYIHPVVIQEWRKQQMSLLHRLQQMDGGLVLAGDGRCDSPGHSAKFGSFSVIEQRLRKVLDVQLVQVS